MKDNAKHISYDAVMSQQQGLADFTFRQQQLLAELTDRGLNFTVIQDSVTVDVPNEKVANEVIHTIYAGSLGSLNTTN